MKTVVFIRHAKSSWKFMDLTDFQRPLNKRGLRDAPIMGERLQKRKIFPDLIVSSTAVRAYATAKIIAKKLNYKIDDIQQKAEIYESSRETVLNILRELPNKKNIVFVFGHNPTFTTLANYFSNDYIPNVPTCGMVAIDFEIDKWQDLDQAGSCFSFFDYPKLESDD
ncbi:MAG: phosphohistidine phosphatase [Cognaticolwellia sp.]|jgi:phosphohistidine phosphatase